MDARQVEEFLEFIPINAIESYELVETEVKGIQLITLNEKPVTINDFRLVMKNIGTPGTVQVTLSIPDSVSSFKIPFLPIKNGIVEVPITLSFVSYAREDEKFVAEVSQRLRDHGAVTWFDRRDLLPGDDWEMRIEKGIENSDFFLSFISRESIDRIGFKNRELMLALKQQSLRPRGRVFLIPILIDDCVPPHDLRNLNWLKISEANWFESLLRTIAPWYIKHNLAVNGGEPYNPSYE